MGEVSTSSIVMVIGLCAQGLPTALPWFLTEMWAICSTVVP